ncbi:O-antigen ligase family protein [Hydrogenophaga sp. Root209]|uniref:O-antigen ligase family protein n=1 Tax=Hydrogenophaga sp. Root209 TaxID=1736490 RepID=UPI0012E37228
MKVRSALRQARWNVAMPGLLLLLSACLALASLGLAVQHPVAPLALPLAILLLILWNATCPQTLWFLLPAALPVMSFTPWTGWWLLDESDVLVLACLAGAFARWGIDVQRCRSEVCKPLRGSLAAVWGTVALSLLVGVLRGAEDAGVDWTTIPVWNEAMYAGYDSAWNTWRVAKSLVWALLIALLLHAPGAADRQGSARLVARGMVVGLGLVGAIAIWERAVYAGLFDFSHAYRTSAWFWEMHVGGGAIDAYLAMAVPFAVWAMWTATTTRRWVGANILTVLSVYVVLTTYSRGVYMAVLIALLFMGITAWRFKLAPAAGLAWGRRTLLAMVSTLILESAFVLSGGSFMADRLAQSDSDLVGRMEHWRSGLGLLKSPDAWMTGLGIGRFSAHYSREVPTGHYPGEALWQGNAGNQTHVLLSGRHDSGQHADLFALTQRVDLTEAGSIHVRLRATGERPSTLLVSLCERHLLYDFSCQRRWVSLKPQSDAGNGWIELRMGRSLFEGRSGVAGLRESVLALSSMQVRKAIRIESVELWDSSGRQRLRNTNFSKGLQHWLPMAQGQFEPWHIDNLYLDVLIERGLLGLVILAVWVLWALLGLWEKLRQGDSVAWAMAASMVGVLSLGAVISVTEVPRVTLILMILLWSSGGFRGQIEDVSRCNRL